MIPAIVLAAGLSRRMGRPKLVLPWGDTTVIGRVVATLLQVGLHEVVVVTGHRADEVASALADMPVRLAFNPDYAAGEMLSSLRVGLAAVGSGAAAEPSGRPPAVLLCLGDQPQMEAGTVRAVLAAGEANGWQRIVIPSYGRRAGHPIVLPAWLWPQILACTGTLRDVLAAHRDRTDYLTVDTPTILADLDTPEEYENAQRKGTPSHAHVAPLQPDPSRRTG